jgi:hypothetical protein
MTANSFARAFLAHLRASAAAFAFLAALGPSCAQSYDTPPYPDGEAQSDEEYGAPEDGPDAGGPYRHGPPDYRYGPPPRDALAERYEPSDRYRQREPDGYEPPYPRRPPMEPPEARGYPPDVERRELPPPVARLAPIPTMPPMSSPPPPMSRIEPRQAPRLDPRLPSGRALSGPQKAAPMPGGYPARLGLHSQPTPKSEPALARLPATNHKLRADRRTLAAQEPPPATKATPAPALKRSAAPAPEPVPKPLATPAAAPTVLGKAPPPNRQSTAASPENPAPSNPPKSRAIASEPTIENKADSKLNLDR